MMTDEKTPGANGAGDQPQDEIGTGVEAGTEQLRAELAEWRDKALRAAADAENMRRRAEREINDARAYAIQRFASDLLGAADNLERALAAAPRDSEDPAERNFVLGIEMTEKALHTAFERNGLKKIESGPRREVRPAPAPGDDGAARRRRRAGRHRPDLRSPATSSTAA